MNKERAPTPGPIARQLRQEAGFGCCKCGHPIIQYHHIVPYSVEAHFRPEDMMALCPNCHDEATAGAMKPERQRYYKAYPHNMKKGFARGLLTINEENVAILIGGNVFEGGGPFIVVDDELMIGLELNEFGCLDLFLNLYDEHDKAMLSIVRNEWVSGDPLPWDIDANYQTLNVRRRKREVALRLNCRRSPIELSGSVWRNGHLIRIAPSVMSVDRFELNCAFSGCGFTDCYIALCTSPQPTIEIRSRN